MTTTAANGRKWVQHVGAAGLPKDFDKLVPLGGQGIEVAKRGFQSGTAWTRLKSGLVLRCDPLPVVGAGAAPARVGAGWAPSGNNFLVSTADADRVCAGNFVACPASGACGQPPSITADIQSWAQSGVSLDDVAFVWSADNKVLYQFTATASNGVTVDNATLSKCGMGAIPDPRTSPAAGACPPAADGTAQVRDTSGNCVPVGSPGTSTTSTTFAKIAPWALGAAALLLGGAVVYAVYDHQKSSGESKRIAGHHAHDNPARGRKRDRHGRFK
jgi:hypothetical protein